MRLTVAAASWPVERPGSFDDLARSARRRIGEAVSAGARVVVLPEYLSMVLSGIAPDDVAGDVVAALEWVQPRRGDWIDLFSGISRETGTWVLAGTFVVATGGGRYRNRADLFTPTGDHLWQDKLQLTGWEKTAGVIDPGDELKVFDLDGTRVGVSVCYDVEFPLPVRSQCEAGARLILVPSATDTPAGAGRVQVGCMARALENRCFVARSVTAGTAPWTPWLDVSTGVPAIHSPMDTGWPADGLLDTSGDGGWAIATLDFEALEASRAGAQVTLDRDWPDQLRPELATVRVETA